MSNRGRFEIILIGADEEHRYVKDYDDEVQATTSCEERNNRAKDLGISARYTVIDTKARTDG